VATNFKKNKGQNLKNVVIVSVDFHVELYIVYELSISEKDSWLLRHLYFIHYNIITKIGINQKNNFFVPGDDHVL
jgi:hypothetical protein